MPPGSVKGEGGSSLRSGPLLRTVCVQGLGGVRASRGLSRCGQSRLLEKAGLSSARLRLTPQVTPPLGPAHFPPLHDTLPASRATQLHVQSVSSGPDLRHHLQSRVTNVTRFPSRTVHLLPLKCPLSLPIAFSLPPSRSPYSPAQPEWSLPSQRPLLAWVLPAAPLYHLGCALPIFPESEATSNENS